MVPCKKTLDFTEWKIWSLVSASLVRYEQKARKYVHKLSYQLCAGLFHSIQSYSSYQRSWRMYRLSFDLALAHLRCGKVDFAFGHWSKKVNIFGCVVSTVDPDSELCGQSQRDLYQPPDRTTPVTFYQLYRIHHISGPCKIICCVLVWLMSILEWQGWVYYQPMRGSGMHLWVHCSHRRLLISSPPGDHQGVRHGEGDERVEPLGPHQVAPIRLRGPLDGRPNCSRPPS